MDLLFTKFANPPSKYGSLPKWFLNTDIENITQEEIYSQFKGFRDYDKYAGVMIVSWKNDHYLSDLYLEKYRAALSAARDLGMTIIIWDENGFPSGQGGGIMKSKSPQHIAKMLEMHEDTIVVNQTEETYTKKVPPGKCMGAVLMNTESFKRKDITDSISNGTLNYTLTAGSWKIMLFLLVDSRPPEKIKFATKWLIDYLSIEAVDALIDCIYQEYYNHFAEYFGNVIKYAFYDEPAFWHIDGGRIWTGDFNQAFEEKNGYDPTTLYPALFMDIGSDTAYARNALFSFRADLYADRYVARIADWCEKHDILLTGHMDQEENLSPVSNCGDLMKVMRGQHIPGIDEISHYNRASQAYKIISSAAYNYDKPAVMCEVFGAMGEDMPVEWLMKQSMDELAKGVNFMVPHGTWYDSKENIIFPPELSFRTERYAAALTECNEYCARASVLLREGRHVCDIAVLYPIDDLQAWYYFDESNPYLGGQIPPYTDYMAIGEKLSCVLRKDFTYMHPETLHERCKVDNGFLYLDNTINFERYKIIILPSINVISAKSIEILKDFVFSGGILISAGLLPSKSIEKHCDNEVINAIGELFSTPGKESSFTCKTHINNGRSYILNQGDEASLAKALDDCGFTFDVSIPDISVNNGNFTYIHKVLDNKDIFFFANSSDDPIDTQIILRGDLCLEAWNPINAKKQPAKYTNSNGVTTLKISLSPIQSMFFVSI